MTAALPSSFAASSPVSVSHRKRNGDRMQFLAKSNGDFREASRREDSNLLRRAFDGRTQAEMAQRGSRALGVSERQFIYWLQMQNDMPSWAVKAARAYLARVDRVASRIEGRR